MQTRGHGLPLLEMFEAILNSGPHKQALAIFFFVVITIVHNGL